MPERRPTDSASPSGPLPEDDEPPADRGADPGPDLQLQNRQRRVRVDLRRLRDQLLRVAAREGLGGRRITVVLVSDRRIRRLNRDFHGRDEPTDVLAFDYGGGLDEDDVDGEVVVSAQRAQEEAGRRGLPVEGELLLYCIHGLLHLAGYEDETPQGRRRMWRRQLAHLARAGYGGLHWRQAEPAGGDRR